MLRAMELFFQRQGDAEVRTCDLYEVLQDAMAVLGFCSAKGNGSPQICKRLHFMVYSIYETEQSYVHEKCELNDEGNSPTFNGLKAVAGGTYPR